MQSSAGTFESGISRWGLNAGFKFQSIGSIKYLYYDESGKLRTRVRRGPNAKWDIDEIRLLRRVYPKATRRQVLKVFPRRSWWSIEGKAKTLGLRRPGKAVISRTLHRQGDIGFSAGMIIADGSVMERLISAGTKRGSLEGGKRFPR